MSGVNMLTTPNHIHIFGNPSMHFWFGGVPQVNPNGLSSHPNIRICSAHITWELTPVFANALSLQLPGALASLPYIPDIHDAYIGGDE